MVCRRRQRFATLSSFDYEVRSRGQISADVTEPGPILIQGKLLADIAKSECPVTGGFPLSQDTAMTCSVDQHRRGIRFPHLRHWLQQTVSLMRRALSAWSRLATRRSTLWLAACRA